MGIRCCIASALGQPLFFTRLYDRLRRLFLLLLALLLPALAYAQRVELVGVHVLGGAYAGVADLPDPATFLANTRDPAFFRSTDRTGATPDGTTTLSTLAIDFVFQQTNRPRHTLALGFARQTVNTTLYTFPATENALPAIELSTVNEYFGLRGTYRFWLRPGRKLSFYAGLGLGVGVPISARTDEVLTAEEADQENEFFARKRALVTGRVPLGLQLKLFGTTALHLGLDLGRLVTAADGTRLSSGTSGLTLGLHFRLRGRHDETP